MGELVNQYKEWKKGTAEDKANAATVLALAKHINRTARRKLAGTFVPSGVEQVKTPQVGFGEMVNNATAAQQSRPGRR